MRKNFPTPLIPRGQRRPQMRRRGVREGIFAAAVGCPMLTDLTNSERCYTYNFSLVPSRAARSKEEGEEELLAWMRRMLHSG